MTEENSRPSQPHLSASPRLSLSLSLSLSRSLSLSLSISFFLSRPHSLCLFCSSLRNEKSAQRPKFSAGRPCGHPAKNFGQALEMLENKHFGTDMQRGRPRKNFGLKNFGLIFRSLFSLSLSLSICLSISFSFLVLFCSLSLYICLSLSCPMLKQVSATSCSVNFAHNKQESEIASQRWQRSPYLVDVLDTFPREARDLISKIRSCTVRSDLKNKQKAAENALF